MELQKDSVLSPMPGKIIACFIRENQTVNKGDPLMIIEAMKMEHSIQAPHDGEIENVFFAVDDQVEEGEILLAFKE
jgi:3-methylcrotonyl-CoA carboxylase alpha subunit